MAVGHYYTFGFPAVANHRLIHRIHGVATLITGTKVKFDKIRESLEILIIIPLFLNYLGADHTDLTFPP